MYEFIYKVVSDEYIYFYLLFLYELLKENCVR